MEGIKSDNHNAENKLFCDCGKKKMNRNDVIFGRQYSLEIEMGQLLPPASVCVYWGGVGCQEVKSVALNLNRIKDSFYPPEGAAPPPSNSFSSQMSSRITRMLHDAKVEI